MRCCVNIRTFVLLLAGLIPRHSFANSYGAEITNAELQLQCDHYVLSAQIHYNLSDSSIEALKNGVPLYWTLHVNIKQHRNWLWDKTLLEKEQQFRIGYHALLNQYLLADPQTGQNQNFSTLSAAMELMSNIRNMVVIDANLIDPAQIYYAELKITFDGNSLPLPLRPIAAIDPHWSLSSTWTLWPLIK